ncbi:transcription termination/antitermination protein NusG [Roseivivax sp. THAF197b]|uniref:transcription termination/antitermination protein NusG n=1 Tax=Roseivivax sp. THAF197b TaxID=2588299 RepID=UPI0012685BD7|nr:transcription termination/antitermination NusG family protein [Roseivivax sp. THAF197b]QFS84796.1 hypothetical protein FIV09_18295 [Roseivivax sp. THAF197b]
MDELDPSVHADNWFAAQLKPNGLTIAERNLKRQGFRHFTPKRLETLRRAEKVVTTPRPLFPGYIFVRFDPANPDWRALNATRGLTRIIVDDPRKPQSLPEDFMAALIDRCDEQGLLKAAPALNLGDTVRVVSGPMVDLVSRIEGFDTDGRIKLLMDLMGRETRVSVARRYLEKLSD